MSLIKNLKRREVEIFGAKRVVRNDKKEETNKEDKGEDKTPGKTVKKQTKKIKEK